MKQINSWFQLVFAAVGGGIGWFLGGWDGFIYALAVFVLLDYVTGVMCAILDRKLSSEVGFRGIFKKILIFALVGVGHILDVQIIGTGGVLRTGIIFFYLSNEGISILENAGHIGLPVPKKLMDVLVQIKSPESDERDPDAKA